MPRTTITGTATRRFLGPTTTLTGGVGITDGGGGNVDLQVAGVTRASVTSEGLAVNGTLSVSGELSESVNGVLANPIPRTLTGPDVLRYLQASRDSCAITPGLDTVRVGPAIGISGSPVLMRDGRVFIVPYNAGTARIFDPSNGSVSTPAGTYPGAYTGVLLLDGRIFGVPKSGQTTAVLYDPASNTASTSAATFPGTSNSFLGGVRLLDGRVFCIPGRSSSGYLYDPTSDTLREIPSLFPYPAVNDPFIGAILMPNGKVFCVPWNSLRAYIFDPVTMTTTSAPSSAFRAFNSAVTMADGRVYCVPSATASTSALVYNYTSNTVSTSGTFSSVNGKFNGGSVLPDGRIVLAPQNETNACIFNPQTNTYSTPTATLTGCAGAVLLQSGDVFVLTGSGSAIIHTGGWGSVKLPLGVLTSPFLKSK